MVWGAQQRSQRELLLRQAAARARLRAGRRRAAAALLQRGPRTSRAWREARAPQTAASFQTGASPAWQQQWGGGEQAAGRRRRGCEQGTALRTVLPTPRPPAPTPASPLHAHSSMESHEAGHVVALVSTHVRHRHRVPARRGTAGLGSVSAPLHRAVVHRALALPASAAPRRPASPSCSAAHAVPALSIIVLHPPKDDG